MSRWASAVVIFSLLGSPGLRAEEPFVPASPGYQLQFPRDHGEHPRYETEWWYLTGHLVSGAGDIFTRSTDYGFQLTFFRRGVRPENGAAEQVYLAHAALTDVRTGQFLAARRIAPAGLGLAGAAPSWFRTWNLGWLMERIGDRLVVMSDLPAEGEGSVELRLASSDLPVPLLHGEEGLSRKGPCSTCTSMYYSLPGISFTGEVIRDGRLEPVRGIGWLDHEFMTNALLPGQEGWDWFSLLFPDGTALMLFRIRATNPEAAWASGTIRRNGVTTLLTGSDFTIEPRQFWVSPKTGARYPAAWSITVPRFDVRTMVATIQADQELPGEGKDDITYYEGAIRGPAGGPLGYVELTGYDKPLGGRL